jgi:hypothetical protein
MWLVRSLAQAAAAAPPGGKTAVSAALKAAALGGDGEGGDGEGEGGVSLDEKRAAMRLALASKLKADLLRGST